MKLKYILIIAITAILTGCSDKYDDSKIWEAIEGLEQRLEAMETVMNAYKNKVLIDRVETTTDGYTIYFADGTQAVIINDKPVNFPEDKDTCYISYIEVDDNEVHFYLSDGTDFFIKMLAAISINFEDQSPVTVMPGQTRTLNFSIESDISDVEVEVISSGDLKAKLIYYNQETKMGSIEVLVAQEVDSFSKVILFANNGRRVSMRRLEFTNEGIGIYNNSKKEIPVDGGFMDLEFVSDVPTKVIIPSNAQSWIKIMPKSRTLEYNCISLELAPNESGTERAADVSVSSEDGSMSVVFHIRQERNVNAVEASEKEALQTIMEFAYKGTDMEYLLNQPISAWPGVTLTDGHVTGLEFFKDLKGEFPHEIGALKYLKSFKADGGLFHIKSLPAEFALLEQLEELYIGSLYGVVDGTLEGSLPDCIYELKNLKKLSILNTHLTSVESNLKQLTKLEYLDLSGNKLTSFDFKALCELKSLRYFDCSINYNLRGYLPEAIGDLKNLENFNISFCNIYGTLPDAIWELGNLKVLGIQGNEFSSVKLPPSIAAMKNLETLAVSDIPLLGSIPSDIGSLKKLRELILENCQLEGNIPSSISQCTNLERITLFMNNIEGSIPTGLGNLPRLKNLNLSHNKLSGQIPDGLGDLESLWLFDNALTGKIPDDLRNSGKLWRNYWGYVVFENNLDFEFETMPGPIDLGIYYDTASLQRFELTSEYSKHEYTILFAFHSKCPFVDDALKILKDAYKSYNRDELEIIGWTYVEEPQNKENFQIPWPLYYGQQLDYPCYVTPTITIFDRNGYVVFCDLIHDRFSLPEWLKEHLGK